MFPFNGGLDRQHEAQTSSLTAQLRHVGQGRACEEVVEFLPQLAALVKDCCAERVSAIRVGVGVVSLGEVPQYTSGEIGIEVAQHTQAVGQG